MNFPIGTKANVEIGLVDGTWLQFEDVNATEDSTHFFVVRYPNTAGKTMVVAIPIKSIKKIQMEEM